MSRPAGCPPASSRAAQTASAGDAFRRISPPNDSAPAPFNYITVDRLYRIASDMTELDRSVLVFVSDSRMATGRQLARRFWHASPSGDSSQARAARRTLARLTEWRVIERLPRRIGGRRAGSDGLVYMVGVAGMKLLAQRGVRRRLEAPGALYVRHTLAVSEMVVRLGEAAHAGELDLIEVETEPQCWRSFLGAGGARLTVKPDLLVRVGVGALEDRWAIEVDLATEASGTLLTKAQRYLLHYRSGSEQSQHGTYPRVLWAAPDARRAGQINDVLRRLPAEAKRLFTICLFEETVPLLAMEART